MQKTKVFTFAVAALILFSFANKAVFAVESEESAEKVVKNLATFEANDENEELKKMILELQSELVKMKDGMSTLQTKVMESEMTQLRTQLLELQNNLLVESSTKNFAKSAAETISDLEANSETETELAPDSEDAEIGAETEIEFYPEDDLAAKLILAEAEIAKLKSKLGEEEEEEVEKEVEKEEVIYEKIEEEPVKKVEKEETGEIELIDVGEKMAKAGEEAEKIAEKESDPEPANIIAKLDGELLYQFPRSFSSREIDSSENTKSLGAENLVADILAENESPVAPNFTRNSASAEKFELFSGQNIAILATTVGLVIGFFIYFLIKNERKLLAYCEYKLKKAEAENDFPLSGETKKVLFARTMI